LHNVLRGFVGRVATRQSAGAPLALSPHAKGFHL
jgi:hypothetical protein